MQTKLIQAGEYQIAIRYRGQGPNVICLHATGHGGRDFDLLAERLENAFSFIALDWPGHGDSPSIDKPASAELYTDILAAVIQTLALDNYFILGNSIGGSVAIQHAITYPNKIEGLILCNSGGLTPVNWITKWYCKNMSKRFAKAAKGDNSFPAWYARYYRNKILTEPAAQWRREEIVAAGPKAASVMAEAWGSFAQPEADIRHLVPKLSTPVLYAWGKKDKVLRWSWARKAALKAADFQVQLFNASHSAFLECPDEFDSVFTTFCQHHHKIDNQPINQTSL